MLIRMLVVGALLCAALPGRSAAQQTSDAPRAAAQGSALLSSPNAPLPGPRVRPLFQQPAAPTLAPIRSGASSSLAAAGGQHTIVVSTLALVLAAIIVVLLAVN